MTGTTQRYLHPDHRAIADAGKALSAPPEALLSYHQLIRKSDIPHFPTRTGVRTGISVAWKAVSNDI